MHPFIHPFNPAIDPPWESRTNWEQFKAIAKTFSEMAAIHLDEMKDLVWKNCVLCERCYCAFGIDIPNMIAFTRSILRSQGISGVYPHTFGAPEDTHEKN